MCTHKLHYWFCHWPLSMWSPCGRLAFFLHISALERYITLTLLFLTPTIGRCLHLSYSSLFQDTTASLSGSAIETHCTKHVIQVPSIPSPFSVFLPLWCCLQCVHKMLFTLKNKNKTKSCPSCSFDSYFSLKYHYSYPTPLLHCENKQNFLFAGRRIHPFCPMFHTASIQTT